MQTQLLRIDGMSCGHCVKAVTLALQHVPGVDVRRVSIGEAEVAFDEAIVTHGQLREAVEEAGYTVVDPPPTGQV